MKIASCLLFLECLVHLDFVELGSEAGQLHSPRSRSYQRNHLSRIRPFSIRSSTSKSSQRAEQSVPNVTESTGRQHGDRGQFFSRKEIYVFEGSVIYLRKPGNDVVSGTLHWSNVRDGIPSWMRIKMNYPRVNSSDSVFFYKPGMNMLFLRADLKNHIHKKDDPNVKGYKFYMRVDEAVLYEADLAQRPEEKEWPVKTTVYVRVPDNNLIYAGELRPIAIRNAPSWINRMNVRASPFDE